MPNYRRIFVPGGCWFFTVNILDRRSRLLVEQIEALRDTVRAIRRDHPFEIDAWVVLPNHLHAIWTLPEGDSDYPVRWRWIKSRFSRALPNIEQRSDVRKARGERGIWQRRYWEHLIRDERDFNDHLEYCWLNPVWHGLVKNVEDWPFSSFHRDRNGQKPDFEAFDAALRKYAGNASSTAYGERD